MENLHGIDCVYESGITPDRMPRAPWLTVYDASVTGVGQKLVFTGQLNSNEIDIRQIITIHNPHLVLLDDRNELGNIIVITDDRPPMNIDVGTHSRLDLCQVVAWNE